MRYHPFQADQEKLKVLSKAFEASMMKQGVLPKNPWRAKRLAAWLLKMGARFHPGSSHYRTYQLDSANYVNFGVNCPKFEGYKPYKQPRIKGYRGRCYVRIEIPWELADKIVILGYLP